MHPTHDQAAIEPSKSSGKPLSPMAIGVLVAAALAILAAAIWTLTPYFAQDAIDADELPGVTEPSPNGE